MNIIKNLNDFKCVLGGNFDLKTRYENTSTACSRSFTY